MHTDLRLRRRRVLSQRHSVDSTTSLLERLEPRAMLAADLGVEFDDVSLPITLVPGDRIPMAVVVSNNGPMAAIGTLDINFYLSTDLVFSSNDVLLGAFPAQQIQLSANDSGTWSDQVTVPPSLVPGNYFFLVRILPGGNIGDTNQSNNLAASGDFWPFVLKFGSFDGRQNVTLSQVDADGSLVTFSLADGGVGTVTRDADRFDIVVTDAGANSRLVIGATGGNGRADLDQVTITGSLLSLAATTSKLLGSLSVSGTLGSLSLGDVGGTGTPSVISIGTAGVNTAVTLGNVANARIAAVGGLASLGVASWSDTGDVEVSTATFIGALTSTGNFGASFRLAGRGSGATLGATTIGGQLTGGAWSIAGLGASLSAASSTVRWSASFTQRLTSFTVTGIFRGVLAAKSIGTVSIGQDLNNAKILAGADLGDDAKLGGTGDNADTFARGWINTVLISRNVVRSIIGAGLDPVDGIFDNGNDRLVGGNPSRFDTFTVAGTATQNSRFLAKRIVGQAMINGAVINTLDDRRFVLTERVLPGASFVSADPAATPTVIRVRFTDNVRLLLSRIGAGDIRVTGPNGFSQVLTFVQTVLSPNQRNVVCSYSITAPGGAWDAGDNGTYLVSVVANQVFDTSLNAVAAGQVGSFQIAL